MGGGICARQLANSSRGILGAVMGAQQAVMGGGQQSEGLLGKMVMGKVGLLRMQSTETRADKVHFQQETKEIQPTRLPTDIFAQKMLPMIHQELDRECRSPTLAEMATYYFDGQGKAVRPALTMLMAKAVNHHLNMQDAQVEQLQRQIALICEMWHTSSLLHDDVIDHAESRRGKESVNKRFNPSRSIFAGDYILGVSAKLLAQTGNPDVVIAMSQILADLVNGEFQQMASRSDSEDRFQLYLDKTFNKTASLMAYSCQSVAILANQEAADPEVVATAYRFGQNIGIAFQLVDDWLDFVASADQLGKPAGADLGLGIATAPVLFASEQFPRLNTLILRQFNQPGDVQEAFQLVLKSEGLEQTKRLASRYSQEAVECLKGMREGDARSGLLELAAQLGRRCH